MTPLGKINNPRACKAFTDYLTIKNIKFEVKLIESDIFVYVEQEQFEQANTLFQDFVSNPNQRKYLQASWQLNQPVSGKTQSLGLAKIWRANGPLTKFITLLCISIYCLSVFGYFGDIFAALSFSRQLDEFYRVFTPAIMHLSAVHLVFNMSWWWYLGGKIEKHLGAHLLLLFSLFIALFSNTVQAILVDNQFAGLSGVVYGLAGFVWLYGKLSKDKNIFLPNNVFSFLIVWMALGFAEVLPINMANWAHLVGLICGLWLARLAWKEKQKKQADNS